MALKTDPARSEASEALLALANSLDASLPLREEALARFDEVGLPHAREEAWRFLNMRGLLKTRFVVPQHAAEAKAREAFELATFEGLTASRLVFVNGFFNGELSNIEPLPKGATVSTMSGGADVSGLGEMASLDTTPFVALNGACAQDVAVIRIPANTKIDAPIHIMNLTVGPEPMVISPRALIVVGESAEVTVIETFLGHDTRASFTNAVTEFEIGASANVDHIKLQREGDETFHIAAQRAHLGREAGFDSNNITLGGLITRNDIGAVIDGEGAHAALDGLNLVAGHQWVDNHTLLDHTVPNCTSHQLYKSVLDDQATTVFNGRIVVHQIAQKTDAIQNNHSLLLSDNATAHTQPNLEIFADDVKCTHGATVGNLDAKQLFYLRSRGIDEANARGLLTFAFANEVIGEIHVEPVRDQLEKHIFARFNRS